LNYVLNYSLDFNESCFGAFKQQSIHDQRYWRSADRRMCPNTPPSTRRAPRRVGAGRAWLKRVFDIDSEYGPPHGGRLQIIAAIVDPPVIAKILRPLTGRPAHRRDHRRRQSIYFKQSNFPSKLVPPRRR
jgi:hypothetical protein